MKGILLAGGSGTRLYPLTLGVSKQLLPVYDKPTIYYPLSTLMLADIRDIMVISTLRDIPMIRDLLGDGSQVGLNLEYRVQEKPNGIAQAFLIAKDWLDESSVCLILGDNIFFGHDLVHSLQKAASLRSGAEIFGYHVHDPERYGVAEIDSAGQVLSIEEKPKQPKSPWAVTGLYFYDGSVTEKAHSLKPSARGELEITDLNRLYLNQRSLKLHKLGRGTAWLDSGTFDSLLEASQFVKAIESRQGLKIACIEEIAYQKGWIDAAQLSLLAQRQSNSPYGSYLKNLLKDSL